MVSDVIIQERFDQDVDVYIINPENIRNKAKEAPVTALLKRIGLPTTAPLAAARDEIVELMHADKKVAAGRIRFVLADAIGHAALHEDIEQSWITAGLDRVLA